MEQIAQEDDEYERGELSDEQQGRASGEHDSPREESSISSGECNTDNSLVHLANEAAVREGADPTAAQTASSSAASIPSRRGSAPGSMTHRRPSERLREKILHSSSAAEERRETAPGTMMHRRPSERLRAKILYNSSAAEERRGAEPGSMMQRRPSERLRAKILCNSSAADWSSSSSSLSARSSRALADKLKEADADSEKNAAAATSPVRGGGTTSKVEFVSSNADITIDHKGTSCVSSSPDGTIDLGGLTTCSDQDEEAKTEEHEELVQGKDAPPDEWDENEDGTPLVTASLVVPEEDDNSSNRTRNQMQASLVAVASVVKEGKVVMGVNLCDRRVQVCLGLVVLVFVGMAAGLSTALGRVGGSPASTPTLPTTSETVSGVVQHDNFTSSSSGQAGIPFYRYSPTGTGNNAQHPLWGSAGQRRIRSHPALNSYADGLSTPRTEADGLPSARRVLLELFHIVPPHEKKDVSQLLLYFGQFIAHDMTRSKEDPNDAMPIPCGSGGSTGSMASSPPPLPPGTCNFASTCPGAAGNGPDASAGASFFRYARSAADAPETDGSGREHKGQEASTSINYATSFLDLDHLYGPIIGGPLESDVRSFVGGKMVLDPQTGLPPKDYHGRYITADPNTRLTPGLAVVAAVFLRYHNLRADFHYEANHNRTDHELYWAARMDTIAAYQNIVEEKYVPTTLGEVLFPYSGYDPTVDPSIDIFFSTCAFRYGHSSLSGLVRLLNPSFRSMPSDPLLLRDVFDQTEAVLDSGSDVDAVAAAILRGIAAEPAKAADGTFADDVSFFTKHMASANVQRGRDAGLPGYNEAREWFGLDSVGSMDELARGNEAVARALKGLYRSVDDVDPYVGGLLETQSAVLGPLMKASMKEQFERVRDGDRYWYKNRLTEDEIAGLPSLSDMAKLTFGEEEMQYFPDDSFAAVDHQLAAAITASEKAQAADDATIALLEDSFSVSWAFTQRQDKIRWIDMTLQVRELVNGGYIGIGWGSKYMRGAEMWYCTAFDNATASSSCTPLHNEEKTSATGPQMFSCCVAQAHSHVVPQCIDEKYSLEVIDSCFSPVGSFVTLGAPLCNHDGDGSASSACFHLPQGETDFIAAYNPSEPHGSHGFSRRTMGRMNLNNGRGSSTSGDSVTGGLFALHGVTMLIGWFVLVPAAIWTVRYCKGKTWRIMAHIILVGVTVSLVFAMATAAFIVVGRSAFSKHKVVGLVVLGFMIIMLFTGEARRRCRTSELNNVLKATRWTDQAVLFCHRCGGFMLLGLAWWNCYTGLQRIIAYESEADSQFFHIFQRYIYFPWITCICLVFLVSEVQLRTTEARHTKRLEAIRRGSDSIWGSEAERDAQDMSIDAFLELTRQGSPLCIVDGFVIDIGSFIDQHPGGSRILRNAVGSDISQHMIGQSDLDGINHKHSASALRKLRTLVKAKLTGTGSENDSSLGSESQTERTPAQPQCRPPTPHNGLNALLYRDATIVDIEHITLERSMETKPVVRVRLALKREKMDVLRTPQPGTTFMFRGKDEFGVVFERPYTPVNCYARKSVGHAADAGFLPTTYRPSFRKSGPKKEEVIYEFFINLIPEGKMSTLLKNKKTGSHIMIQGPLADKKLLMKINNKQDTRDVILIAASTGIAPMLQVIDYYCNSQTPASLEPPRSSGGVSDKPKVFLAWFVHSKARSFEGAAQLELRAQQFCGNFRYSIIYAEEKTSSTLQGTRKRLKNQSITFSGSLNKLGAGLAEDSDNASLPDSDGKRRPSLKSLDSHGRLDKALIAKLLHAATDKNYDASLYGEEAIEDGDGEGLRRTQTRELCLGTRVAVCGRPAFDSECMDILTELGFDENQLFTFSRGNSSSGQVVFS